MTEPHICVILVGMKPNRPGLTAPQRVSAALLRDELTNSAAAVRTAEQRLSEARTERDSIIREASSLVPMLTLARLTGLSRDRIYKIVYSGTPLPPTDPQQPTE